MLKVKGYVSQKRQAALSHQVGRQYIAFSQKYKKKKVESPSPTPDLKNPKIIKIGESLREKFFYERLPAAETAAVAILLSLSLFTS